MIEVFFLGTGSTVPNIDRFHPGVALRRKGEIFLFDCGEGCQIRIQQLHLSPHKINHIFISHFHGDHCFGLPGLLYSMGMNNRNSPLHIHSGSPETMQTFVEFLEEDVPYEIIYEGPEYEGKEVSVHATKTEHSAFSYAYRFEERPKINVQKAALEARGIPDGPWLKQLREGNMEYNGKTYPQSELTQVSKGKSVVYSGDTLPMESMASFAKGADLLIHECTYGKDLMDKAKERRHSWSSAVGKIAAAAGAKKLALMHFSRRYDSTNELLKEAKEFFDNTFVAEDTMNVRV